MRTQNNNLKLKSLAVLKKLRKTWHSMTRVKMI